MTLDRKSALAGEKAGRQGLAVDPWFFFCSVWDIAIVRLSHILGTTIAGARTSPNYLIAPVKAADGGGLHFRYGLAARCTTAVFVAHDPRYPTGIHAG